MLDFGLYNVEERRGEGVGEEYHGGGGGSRVAAERVKKVNGYN